MTQLPSLLDWRWLERPDQVDSAIIREYRVKAKLQGESDLDHDSKNPHHKTHRHKTRRKTFRPTPTRCCKIGYKVAKRKLSCDIRVLEVVRKYNDLQRAKMKYNRPRKIRPSKISAKLSTKLGKCAASYPQFFQKCCKYRDQYYTRLTKCKQKPSRERRRCRQHVRRQFRVSKKKAGKKQARSKSGKGRRKA
ncbi:hypothetical protein ACOMHN_062033 [Nucella lapillus]